MKPLFTFSALCVVLCLSGWLLTGCSDDEKEFRNVEFTTASSDIHEGDTIEILLTLNEPVRKTEYITFSVTSSDAKFGVDYGIDNLFELAEYFTIKVPANSSTASFSFIALEDFETEAQEEVRIEIDEVSDGLMPQAQDFHEITINNTVKHETNNRAILFDGIDDYIDLGNIYDDVSLPLTISAWIWLDPSAPDNTAMPIFDSQDGLPFYNGFNFLTSTTSVAGVQYGDGLGENHSVYRRAKAATFSPVAGRWVNFTAVVRGATDMSIYFNGVDVGGEYFGESNNPMKSNSPDEVAKIGAFYQNGVHYKFKGRIDELKIWDKALSEEEVQKTIFVKSSSAETGLIGYWNFDEPTGETVYDQSASEFNGMIKGNATRVLSEVPVR